MLHHECPAESTEYLIWDLLIPPMRLTHSSLEQTARRCFAADLMAEGSHPRAPVAEQMLLMAMVAMPCSCVR